MLTTVFLMILQDNDGQKLWLSECPVCHNSLLCFGVYLYNQLQLTLDRVISDYYKAGFIHQPVASSFKSILKTFVTVISRFYMYVMTLVAHIVREH